MSGAGREPGGTSRSPKRPRESATPVAARTSRDERHDRYVAQRDILFGVFTDSEGSSRSDTPQLIPGDEGPSWEVRPVDRAGFPGFPHAMQPDDEGLHVSPTDGVQEDGDSSGRSSPRNLASIPHHRVPGAGGVVCLQEAEPQVRHQVPEGAVEAEAEAGVEFRR